MIRKFGKRRRNLHALRHHIRPLALEILQRGEVRLPRLGITRIHRVVLIGTVLIAQARIAMTELMYQHLLERRMIRGRKRNLVVDAAATIRRRIHQYDDLLERHIAQGIIDAMNLARSEITVRIESIVMRASHRVLPFPFVWNTRTLIERWSRNCHYVESRLERSEWFALEDGIGSPLRILIELIHLVLAITLGDDGEVHTVGSLSALHDVAVRDAILAQWSDEDILRIDGMAQFCGHLLMRIAQGDTYIHRLLRERHEETALE